LHVQYLRPGQGERFFCRAKVKHAGAKISFVQMELADQDGLVLATGIATFRAAG
jgi:acyl-coenzyme A thioesterase PaaI-like protein